MTFRADPLWKVFSALWTALPSADGKILVAGGYGLFLKQTWLLTYPEVRTVIPIRDWRDGEPRVTNDLDLILDLKLIASEESQNAIAETLRRQGFEEVSGRERWQFRKSLSQDLVVLVDLHAEPPPQRSENPIEHGRRIKHKPSLGSAGVHGRLNPEALGGDMHPFAFNLNGIRTVVPNPVTWAVMKLVSTQDRLRRSEAAEENREREFQQAQATKHARDVMRVVAMTTLEERDQAQDVTQAIRDKEAFVQARKAFDALFRDDAQWGSQVALPQWAEPDWRTIRAVLNDWFK
ncbi:MAG: hypothetical protein NTW19_02635 [Planctomycetota bacterium]|nr:hypothetical protein [Planctomycetota bacterium]